MVDRLNAWPLTLRRWWGLLTLLLALLVSCTGTVEDAGTPVKPGQSANCASGQQSCGGTCIDVLANPANCGACGKACAADQVCDQGACKAKAQGCSGGLLACGGGCVDPLTSA